MSSIEPSEGLRLEIDLPTTEEDVAMLRRLRDQPDFSFPRVLQWLSDHSTLFGEPTARRSAEDWTPFEL